MSGLAAVALALLAGLYTGWAARGDEGELPHELDRVSWHDRMAAEAAAHREWSRAAGESEAEDESAVQAEPGEGGEDR